MVKASFQCPSVSSWCPIGWRTSHYSTLGGLLGQRGPCRAPSAHTCKGCKQPWVTCCESLLTGRKMAVTPIAPKILGPRERERDLVLLQRMPSHQLGEGRWWCRGPRCTLAVGGWADHPETGCSEVAPVLCSSTWP